MLGVDAGVGGALLRVALPAIADGAAEIFSADADVNGKALPLVVAVVVGGDELRRLVVGDAVSALCFGFSAGGDDAFDDGMVFEAGIIAAIAGVNAALAAVAA